MLMGVANSFSGGIFLAAGLIHMLPEAEEKFKRGMKADKPNAPDIFPFTYLAAMLSFSLVLFIDKIVFAGSHSHNHDSHNHNHSHSNND
jgi:solute carrier family 39 (zinc transporter), member 1/2/3